MHWRQPNNFLKYELSFPISPKEAKELGTWLHRGSQFITLTPYNQQCHRCPIHPSQQLGDGRNGDGAGGRAAGTAFTQQEPSPPLLHAFVPISFFPLCIMNPLLGRAHTGFPIVTSRPTKSAL